MSRRSKIMAITFQSLPPNQPIARLHQPARFVFELSLYHARDYFATRQRRACVLAHASGYCPPTRPRSRVGLLSDRATSLTLRVAVRPCDLADASGFYVRGPIIVRDS